MLIFRLSPIDEFVVKFSIYSCRKSKTMSLVKELTHFLSLSFAPIYFRFTFYGSHFCCV